MKMRREGSKKWPRVERGRERKRRRSLSYFMHPFFFLALVLPPFFLGGDPSQLASLIFKTPPLPLGLLLLLHFPCADPPPSPAGLFLQPREQDIKEKRGREAAGGEKGVEGKRHTAAFLPERSISPSAVSCRPVLLSQTPPGGTLKF